MIVLDASVLTNGLTDDGPLGAVARGELEGDAHWAAPAHLVVETFSAIRGRLLGGRISPERAADAIADLQALVVEAVPVALLVSRMWELRANATGYDAAYLAAAEYLDCDLVTADTRLRNVPGVRCTVRMAL